jgi:LPS export ABC transporter protein LptC
MKHLFNNIFLSVVTVFAVTTFFSCKDNYKQIQQLSQIKKMPSGEAYNFKLIYTDSGRVKAILESDLNKDFSNQSFPYQEFPKGLKVEFFDKQKNKSTVTADYGIIYRATNLVNLMGNVVLKSHDGKELHAQQMYWDQKNEWLFTEKSYIFTDSLKNLSGIGLDFNKEFTIVHARNNSGSAIIDE